MGFEVVSTTSIVSSTIAAWSLVICSFSASVIIFVIVTELRDVETCCPQIGCEEAADEEAASEEAADEEAAGEKAAGAAAS